MRLPLDRRPWHRRVRPLLLLFVAGLERLGRWRRTLFLFVSDHGEEFLDHGGFGHGRTLYEEQLRIPRVWRLPGARGGAAGGTSLLRRAR